MPESKLRSHARTRDPVTPNLQEAMLDMRTLPEAAAGLELSDLEQRVLAHVAEGLSPKEIAARVDMPEGELYRLVARVLDELEPAPGGQTMQDIYARHGGRPAHRGEVAEFERRYGPSLPPDGEG